MDMIRKIFFKEISISTAFSIILGILTIIWLVNCQSLWFFGVLYAVMVASAIMLVYVIITWRKLTRTDRWGIIRSILAWLVMGYIVVHINGLTVSSLFVS